MICPKCTSVSFRGFGEGYDICMSCGSLVDSMPITPMRYEPKEEVKGPSHHGIEKNITYTICMEHKGSIINWREEKSSWDTITNLLKKQTNVRMCSKSVQKYSLIIIGYDPRTDRGEI